MGLAPGSQFGPYEILSLIGTGGMGEVYRARDKRLARDVAIKVLPDAWLSDSDRRSRFDREARLLAQLNHPNVGTIYGLEHHGEVTALVLELVEGPTLGELLDRGHTGDRLPGQRSGLPIAEVLKLGRQIAAALEATHDRGIVHRDLKPANIKITPGGVVKVIDFGLARDVSSESDDASAQTAAATHAGQIIGTPAYMSPEQARGKPVDKRSDIWSFGCVLFEMLTGRSPFHGDSVADALAAVLAYEPDWRALGRQTPANIERLLRRCLEKDHTRRLRDIGEARLEFEAAPHTPAASSAPSAQPSARPWVTLVVLPFHNLSLDPEQDYFSDGLTDETIAAIGEMNPEQLRWSRGRRAWRTRTRPRLPRRSAASCASIIWSRARCGVKPTGSGSPHNSFAPTTKLRCGVRALIGWRTACWVYRTKSDTRLPAKYTGRCAPDRNALRVSLSMTHRRTTSIFAASTTPTGWRCEMRSWHSKRPSVAIPRSRPPGPSWRGSTRAFRFPATPTRWSTWRERGARPGRQSRPIRSSLKDTEPPGGPSSFSGGTSREPSGTCGAPSS
ncbi:MAG: protein kinase domain-containing protein [Vicinamibacterales bacterium]